MAHADIHAHWKPPLNLQRSLFVIEWVGVVSYHISLWLLNPQGEIANYYHSNMHHYELILIEAAINV
jgi:hypothetical protein